MAEKPPKSDETMLEDDPEAQVVAGLDTEGADPLGATEIGDHVQRAPDGGADPLEATVGAPDPPERASSSSLTTGTIIADTYEVEKLIGSGGMGAVWSATHQRLAGRRVAIKVLHGAGVSDELLARFRHEAEAAARIGREHIVDVLDYNTLPSGEPYIVMEHLDGEALSERLTRGALEVEEALRVAHQMALALHAAHGEGVIHRDLKPDNVFLCNTSGSTLVKVLDFGISKVHDSDTVKTADAVVMGTPCYMSPEQAFGKSGEADARSDVFSLGTIVYEMLAGERAFGGDNPISVLYRIVHEPPEPLSVLAPDAPPSVVAAVEQAMAKRPEDRFEDMAAFIAALTGQAPVEDEVSKAGPSTHAAQALSTGPSADPSILPPAEPRQPRPLVGFVVGALVVIALVFTFRSGGPPQQDEALSSAPTVSIESAPPPRAAQPPASTVEAEARPAAQPALSAQGKPEVVETKSASPAIVQPAPVEARKPAKNDETPKRAKRPAAAKHESAPAKPAVEKEPPAALVAARSAFKAGDMPETIRQARKSLRQRMTMEAYALMAKAFCRQTNLPGATGAIKSLRGGTKRHVEKYCRKLGMNL